MGFMQRLQRFMYGRYGGDTLNLVILAAGMLWSIIWRFTPFPYVSYLSYAFLGWTIFRMLSRNVTKRRAENDWFRRAVAPVAGWFRKLFSRTKDKDHKYFSCPKCRQTCRVPKGRGRIQINCPKCGEHFVRIS